MNVIRREGPLVEYLVTTRTIEWKRSRVKQKKKKTDTEWTNTIATWVWRLNEMRDHDAWKVMTAYTRKQGHLLDWLIHRSRNVSYTYDQRPGSVPTAQLYNCPRSSWIFFFYLRWQRRRRRKTTWQSRQDSTGRGSDTGILYRWADIGLLLHECTTTGFEPRVVTVRYDHLSERVIEPSRGNWPLGKASDSSNWTEVASDWL